MPQEKTFRYLPVVIATLPVISGGSTAHTVLSFLLKEMMYEKITCDDCIAGGGNIGSGG